MRVSVYSVSYAGYDRCLGVLSLPASEGGPSFAQHSSSKALSTLGSRGLLLLGTVSEAVMEDFCAFSLGFWC